MILHISVCSASGTVKAEATGTEGVELLYCSAYEPGDRLCLESGEPGFVVVSLSQTLLPVCGWLRGAMYLSVPFGENALAYSPMCFAGTRHLLSARLAADYEVAGYRNLAGNSLDSHENSGLFPHAAANVETRGEAVFAARNAVDGLWANRGHGPWPYQSWGINQRQDASITIDFGRRVLVDRVVLVTRADFPHDSWWTQGTVTFSDGTGIPFPLLKTAGPQNITFPQKETDHIILGKLKKAADSSPFPALTQLEVWGRECAENR